MPYSMPDIFKVKSTAPAINKGFGFEDLGDDPDNHRWRAWWERSNYDSTVTGIFLTAHPVVKRTPQGAWINVNGYREATRQPWEEGAPALEWVPFDEGWMKKRFVLDGSNSAWAKPTQEEAINSLAIRLSRWSNHVASEVEKVWSAAKVMEALRPQYPSHVQIARANMRSAAAMIKTAAESAALVGETND